MDKKELKKLLSLSFSFFTQQSDDNAIDIKVKYPRAYKHLEYELSDWIRQALNEKFEREFRRINNANRKKP
jgi:hypothetical protein